MNRFFQRIFLSVWVITISTVLLTSLIARSIPEAKDNSRPLYKQLAHSVATGLRETLQQGKPVKPEALAQKYVLSADNVIQVFIVDPQGEEIFGRDIDSTIDLSASDDNTDGLIVIRDGLAGYTVVGERKYFPIAHFFIMPWARLILAISALIVSIAVSLALTHYIVKPIRLIREAGQKVATGDLSVRVSHKLEGRRDDLALLATDFDYMTKRIDSLLEKQKQLMRDVSHELRSPLTRLQALFSLARQKLDNQESTLEVEFLDRMETESERLNSLIERILVFTRLDSGKEINRHKTDLMDLLEVIAEDASIEGFEQKKHVLVKGPKKCVINVDSALIHSAFENIIRNALRYTQTHTDVIVELFESKQSVTVEISDHGPGVPEQDLTLLFEPFFRVEVSRNHNMGEGGIGLAIAERAIRLHGGSIKAQNKANGGLKVILLFPKTSS